MLAGFLAAAVLAPTTTAAEVPGAPNLINEIGLVTLAVLQRRVNTAVTRLPDDWSIARVHRDWTGLDVFVFRNKGIDATVMAIKGVEIGDPRDVISMLMRRAFQRYSPYSRRLAERWRDEWNPDRFVIVGHSGGGGLASWLGAELGVPTATFNAGRTEASLTNDGHRQVNVIIRGDEFGDPISGLYGMPLPGIDIYLDADRGEGTHWMATVIAALERSGY
jgi:pimeloyl-ACP methyl ester carboxylesterase